MKVDTLNWFLQETTPQIEGRQENCKWAIITVSSFNGRSVDDAQDERFKRGKDIRVGNSFELATS